MLQMGRNVEAVRYMQLILTDVRSLDIISRDRAPPALYSAADMDTMVQRIGDNAYQVKIRLNAILENNHAKGSSVLKLLFYSPFRAWQGNDVDGSDMYSNTTVWEALTRFYAMSVNVVQYHSQWMAEGVHPADTVPGQYLLKTGPDLYSEFRKTTDALLYETVDSVHWVDNLQLIFLAVEGCAVSFLAACYLGYLLRAVSVQRLSLYRCFLLIPVGLSRVLASQNTTLVVDEDDESEAEEEADKMGGMEMDNDDDGENGGGDGAAKPRRHATLQITADGGFQLDSGGGGGGAEAGYGRSRSGGRRPSGGGIGSPRPDQAAAERRNSDRGLRTRMSSAGLGGGGGGGCWGGVRAALRRVFSWRNSGVSPLPSSAGPLGSGHSSSRRALKNDSNETVFMMMPFIMWSALVIAFYITAVLHMKGMIEVVAIHSVVNRISARTCQSIFFSQELAMIEDPAVLPVRRAKLLAVLKLARDAWLTLQLGADAYMAGGPGTEQFPLVKQGLSYASPALSELFYGAGKCLRLQEHLPCPGPDYRFYQITQTGLDSMMQQFLMTINSMGTNKSTSPEGLSGGHFDYVYSVGGKELLDGTIRIRDVHYDLIVSLFDRIMLLHIILFLLLWAIFIGFIFFLLNPLLRRVVKERRRIAELMSQLPLELDVEKLISRALGATAGNVGGGTATGVAHTVSDNGYVDGEHENNKGSAMNKWRAILRSTTPQARAQAAAAGARVG